MSIYMYWVLTNISLLSYVLPACQLPRLSLSLIRICPAAFCSGVKQQLAITFFRIEYTANLRQIQIFHTTARVIKNFWKSSEKWSWNRPVKMPTPSPATLLKGESVS